jgi:uncharacterized membrane protein HdeD (DUF308 family)
MYSFLSGATMMGCFVAAVFFYRFWRHTMDRLFVWFALAFALMGIERLVLAITSAPETASPGTNLIRLVAFALIIAAIVDKNRLKR